MKGTNRGRGGNKASCIGGVIRGVQQPVWASLIAALPMVRDVYSNTGVQLGFAMTATASPMLTATLYRIAHQNRGVLLSPS